MFNKLTIKSRLILILSLLSILAIGVGILGLYGMSKTKEGLRTVYEDRTVPMDQLADVQKLLLTNRLRITAALLNPSPPLLTKTANIVERNMKEVAHGWDAYAATYLTPEEKILADKFAADLKVFKDDGLSPTVAAMRTNDVALSRQLLEDKLKPLYEPPADGLQSLFSLQLNVAKQEYESAVGRYERTSIVSISAISLGVLLGALMSVFLIRGISRSIATAQQVAAAIAGGKLDSRIDTEQRDEIGQLLRSLKAMQDQLLERITADRKVADESLRIKIGLDNVSTGVIIADNDRNIIYVNKSVVKILGYAEADIRKQLPGFSVAKLLGSSIDSFHKNPLHQAKLLSTLTGSHTAPISLGSRSMVVTASPVINERGERLGVVAEWLDRTVEVAVENEVAAIVDAAVNGNFTSRIEMRSKEGFFKQLGEGINQLMQTSETGLNEVVRVLGAMSQGDLTEKITNEYHGTFGQLKNDSNSTVDKLKIIISEIKEATDAINTASKEIASGNSDLSQRTEEQASGLEETASSMEELTATVKQNAENARQANQLAIGASDVAGKGGTLVGQVITTMDSINESSRKIVDIIAVIDGIAFQTNILALNAAVEAARAGEQGRGFAVVASEVRNLAQRSAGAAKEIKTLIGDSVEKVEGGSKLVAQAGKTMEEIVTSIRRVTDIVSEIAAASLEQSSGIEQINTAISKMDEMTQQNAALVEEAAAAAESLEDQSQNLMNSVSAFKVDANARAIMQHAPALKLTAHVIGKTVPHKAVVTTKSKANAKSNGKGDDW